MLHITRGVRNKAVGKKIQRLFNMDLYIYLLSD